MRYWRSLSGAEVDFVLEGPGGLLAIEVKAGAPARRRISRSASSFVAAYAPGELWLVGGEGTTEIETHVLDRTRIQAFGLEHLPEQIRRWHQGGPAPTP